MWRASRFSIAFTRDLLFCGTDSHVFLISRILTCSSLVLTFIFPSNPYKLLLNVTPYIVWPLSLVHDEPYCKTKKNVGSGEHLLLEIEGEIWNSRTCIIIEVSVTNKKGRDIH